MSQSVVNTERPEVRELMAQLEKQGWELTPEQDAMINGIAIEDMGEAIYRLKEAQERLKKLARMLSKARKAAKQEDEFLRARISDKLSTTEIGKASDPAGKWSLGLAQAPGRVELAPGCTINDVDPLYLTPEVVFKIDTKLARSSLEAGVKVAGLVLAGADEKVVRLYETEKGKLERFEAQVKREIEAKP
jgi:hypothetical protein